MENIGNTENYKQRKGMFKANSASMMGMISKMTRIMSHL